MLKQILKRSGILIVVIIAALLVTVVTCSNTPNTEEEVTNLDNSESWYHTERLRISGCTYIVASTKQNNNVSIVHHGACINMLH